MKTEMKMKAEVLYGYENKGYELIRFFQEEKAYRHSFNKLTKKTFGFDFEQWYLDGYWKENYQPYTIFHEGVAIANVSVNPLLFQHGDKEIRLLQIGTVMTDIEHRGEGLGKALMERILKEWVEQVDGIYLFGNDGVLSYYPKFGFHKQREDQYFISREMMARKIKGFIKENRGKPMDKPAFMKYELDHFEKVSYLEQRITTAKKHRFDMKENLALHMFYLRYLMADQLYYHDEKEIFIVAKLEEGELKISHIYIQEETPVLELAIQLVYDVFWEAYSKKQFSQISFSFIPKETNELERRIYKEDDSTLFVLTRDGNSVFDNEKLMFPIITHT